MARLPILEYPDPRLRIRAERVTVVDEDVKRLVEDMFETMYTAPGIGLAATQVDVHKRIIVIDVSDGRDQPYCFINPEIVTADGRDSFEEGCLSVPGLYEFVERAERIKVKALDRNGEPFELEADGLLAVAIQHELDHLNGVLMIDKLSALKKRMMGKKLAKARQEHAST